MAGNRALTLDALGDADSILGSVGPAIQEAAAAAGVEVPAAAKSPDDGKKAEAKEEPEEPELDYRKALESELFEIRRYIDMKSLAEDEENEDADYGFIFHATSTLPGYLKQKGTRVKSGKDRAKPPLALKGGFDLDKKKDLTTVSLEVWKDGEAKAELDSSATVSGRLQKSLTKAVAKALVNLEKNAAK